MNEKQQNTRIKEVREDGRLGDLYNDVLACYQELYMECKKQSATSGNRDWRRVKHLTDRCTAAKQTIRDIVEAKET